MAKTTQVVVGTTPTPCPEGPITTRRRILLENHDGATITIGFDSGLAFGAGHLLAPDATMTLESGDILYAISEAGGANLIVTEIE